MNLVNKYFPKGLKDIVGLSKEIEEIVNFVSKKPKGKALLLVGPEGSGKTSSVYAVAGSLGLDVIEINASDNRNAESIRDTVIRASKQSSLFNKGKIILIDEVDGIQGTYDKGGTREIKRLIKESKWPVIMTANDEWNKRISSIKQGCKVVRFKRRGFWDILKLLKSINEKEEIGLSLDSLKKIASLSQGDVRSALNDLQIVKKDEDVNNLEERIKELNIFDLLKMVFKSSTFENLFELSKRVELFGDQDPFLWIGENIPNEYEKREEIVRAYDMISKADLFLGRAERTRYWRFAYYAKLLAVIGVGLSKDKPYRKWTRYQTPAKINTLFSTTAVRNKMKALAEEIGAACHCSSQKAMEEYLPYYKLWNKDV